MDITSMAYLNKHKHSRGQAATELAIFGAIIIFLVGAMVRTAISNGYSQTENLKAMRYAMLKSWESSQAQSTSRTTTTIIYIEDRLSADFGKYGPLERTPFVAQASGTFSNLMFYPVDLEDVENSLPIMDVFVNGVHLPLTTAGIKYNYPLMPPVYIGHDGNIHFYSDWYPEDQVPDPVGTGHYQGWNFKCVQGCVKDVKGWWGCPMFYTAVVNGTTGFCTSNCSGPLSVDERFDLNRNDDFSDDPKSGTKTRIPREKMAWQWNAVNATSDKITIDTSNGNYLSYDIDGDNKEETIYDGHFSKETGIVRDLTVLDYQDGNIDVTHDEASLDQGRVGMLNDTAIYTMPRGGPKSTYFEIREGNLVDPTNKTVVRSLSRRDQVDIIERRFRLSNDSTMRRYDSDFSDPNNVHFVVRELPRFCNGNVPVVWTGTEKNPVEACGQCLPISNGSQANLALTCYDPDTQILYVRSRLANSGGHKWLTGIAGSKGTWGELKIP